MLCAVGVSGVCGKMFGSGPKFTSAVIDELVEFGESGFVAGVTEEPGAVVVDGMNPVGEFVTGKVSSLTVG